MSQIQIVVAMHSLWCNSDITTQIAEECAPEYRSATVGDRLKFGTLCSLARTCHALAEPALDVIWHYQFGLANIFLASASSIPDFPLESKRVVLPDDAGLPDDETPPRWHGDRRRQYYQELVSCDSRP